VQHPNPDKPEPKKKKRTQRREAAKDRREKDKTTQDRTILVKIIGCARGCKGCSIILSNQQWLDRQ
jgi:hypothetical protein